MNAKQIRQALMTAFGVKTSKELKKHLKKTDLRSKAEMLHAAAVVWNYSQRYEVKDRYVLNDLLNAQSEELGRKLAIDAKWGFGYYDAHYAA